MNSTVTTVIKAPRSISLKYHFHSYKEEHHQGQPWVISTPCFAQTQKAQLSSGISLLLFLRGHPSLSRVEIQPLALLKRTYSGQIPFTIRGILKAHYRRESDILNERLPPHIIEPNRARDYFGRRGLYSLEESAERLARTTSIGTTYSSSPSTRKRSIEASAALVQQAKMLLKAAANEIRSNSYAGESRVRGRQSPKLQKVLVLLKQMQERERKAGSRLAEVMEVVDDLSFKPETDSSQMTVSST